MLCPGDGWSWSEARLFQSSRRADWMIGKLKTQLVFWELANTFSKFETRWQGDLQMERELRQQRYDSLETIVKLWRFFLFVAATSLRAGFQVYLSKLWVVDVTKAVRYDLLVWCFLSKIILNLLLVAATSLRAGFQAYLSKLWVLRRYQSSAIRFAKWLPHFLIRRYPWKWWVDGYYHQMWQVSCRRQGMLTQGPAPDPKSKF